MYRRSFVAAPSADTDVQGVKLDAGPDVATNERSVAAHNGYRFVPVTTIPISRLPHLEQLKFSALLCFRSASKMAFETNS